LTAPFSRATLQAARSRFPQRLCHYPLLLPFARDDNEVEDFLDAHPHVFLHNTTHASWLNQVELLFSILERRLLCHGEFASIDDLADRIIVFIEDHNRKAQPFKWTNDGRPFKVP